MEIKQLYALFLRSTGVTTDSRTLKGGELFFALKGENFDGNAFLFNGEPYDCNQATNKQSYDVDTNSIGLDPKFKDAAKGNFRPTNLIFLNFENAPGDPRWVDWVNRYKKN